MNLVQVLAQFFAKRTVTWPAVIVWLALLAFVFGMTLRNASVEAVVSHFVIVVLGTALAWLPKILETVLAAETQQTPPAATPPSSTATTPLPPAPPAA